MYPSILIPWQGSISCIDISISRAGSRWYLGYVPYPKYILYWYFKVFVLHQLISQRSQPKLYYWFAWRIYLYRVGTSLFVKISISRRWLIMVFWSGTFALKRRLTLWFCFWPVTKTLPRGACYSSSSRSMLSWLQTTDRRAWISTSQTHNDFFFVYYKPLDYLNFFLPNCFSLNQEYVLSRLLTPTM